MTEAEIKSTLLSILKSVAPDIDPGTLKPDDNFRAVMGIDSFDHLRIITAISERCGVEIPEADHGKIRTLNELVNYIADRSVAANTDPK
jgi:acyl carrier protein